MPMPEQIDCRIEQGITRRDSSRLEEIFDKHKDPATNSILKEQFVTILESLGVFPENEPASVDESNYGSIDHGAIDFQEFKRAASVSSALERLIRTLPLVEMVADALPKEKGRDPIRLFSEITTIQIQDIFSALLPHLEKLLIDCAKKLKASFDRMDTVQAEAAMGVNKFELIPMSVGKIDDFHQGLSSRVGTYLYTWILGRSEPV
jgi:hypothetical protein